MRARLAAAAAGSVLIAAVIVGFALSHNPRSPAAPGSSPACRRSWSTPGQASASTSRGFHAGRIGSGWWSPTEPVARGTSGSGSPTIAGWSRKGALAPAKFGEQLVSLHPRTRAAHRAPALLLGPGSGADRPRRGPEEAEGVGQGPGRPEAHDRGRASSSARGPRAGSRRRARSATATRTPRPASPAAGRCGWPSSARSRRCSSGSGRSSGSRRGRPDGARGSVRPEEARPGGRRRSCGSPRATGTPGRSSAPRRCRRRGASRGEQAPRAAADRGLGLLRGGPAQRDRLGADHPAVRDAGRGGPRRVRAVRGRDRQAAHRAERPVATSRRSSAGCSTPSAGRPCSATRTFTSPGPRPTASASSATVDTPADRQSAGGYTTDTNNPPLYYFGAAAVYHLSPWTSLPDRVHLLRAALGTARRHDGAVHLPLPPGAAAEHAVGLDGRGAGGRLPADVRLHLQPA